MKKAKSHYPGINWRWITLTVLSVIVIAALLYVSITSGRAYFRRRNIRLMARAVNDYGLLAPLAVFFLIFISTVIPPLPLPIPLIEIAAGYVFGFGEGLVLVWISEIISSLAAFAITRYLGRKLFKKILASKFVIPYRQYVERNGAWAIVVTRVFMAAPMNIVSFLAGLTPMNPWLFVGATALGIVPEAILYPYVGMLLKTTRFSLWRLFIIIVIIGAIGPAAIYIFTRIRKSGQSKRKKTS